jgi:methyltransferase, FkbM family
MISINKENLLKHKLLNVLFTISNRIENNNNPDIDTNGESIFLKRFLTSFNKGITIFDVGANIGHYSEIIINNCAEKNINYNLHLFEPTKSCFAELTAKFKNNEDVALNNFGVSDSDGISTIYYDNEKSGFASLYKRDMKQEKVEMNKSEAIVLKRLDAYIEENKIPNIDLLKIDIEGHEIYAFKGLGKYLSGNFISAIQFEYGGTNVDSHTLLKDIYSMLEPAGFEIYKIMKTGLEKREYTGRMENFQYANFVALSKSFVKK